MAAASGPAAAPGLWERVRARARGGWRAFRERYPAVFVAVFIGLLFLPLRGFPGNFTDFSKMFWGYDTLIRAYSGARFSLLKDQIFGDAFVRPGPWLAYTGETSLDDYQNVDPFSSKDLARIQQNIAGLDARLGEQEIRFLVVIVPGKNTIYPEAMPREIPVLQKESRTDQVMAYQNQHGQGTILDLRPALRQAREARQVYYATDTHWNQYGIFAGYTEIMRALQKDFPNLKAHTLEDFQPVTRGLNSGDLSKEWTQGFAREEMIGLEPRFERKTVTFPLSQGSALIPGRIVAAYTPDESLPRAVIYHDSFFNEMMPFLSDHFRWVIYDWAFKVDENFVAGEKPDIVIFEVTDRYLSRLLTMSK
jgi:alginate O-acetyltransferase complex protein AlgJ